MGDVTGLVMIVMIFSIPLCAIWAGALKERYRTQQGQLSRADRERVDHLLAAADSMQVRISALESILDEEVPEWREDHDR